VSLTDLTIRGLAEALARGETSSEEATRACLERIRTTDETLGAFLHVDEERALERARASDARRREGKALGPLDGIPVAIKDNISLRGMPTTCASKILEGYVPPFDATVVERLEEAGAVVLGKLNMDEFAMGSTTETSAFRVCRNPWDVNRSPGGSSGGAAAATAARQVFGALGTDTGGSIRQPASHCGVVGIKPTYGRCSRYGVVAYASSMDQVGTFGRTVEDAALLLQAIAGHDPRDATSLDEPVPDWVGALEGASLEGMRIGIPKELFVKGLDPEVESTVRAAIAQLVSAGAKVEEISLPHTEHATAVYYAIAPAEASSNLSRFDGIRYGLSVREGGMRDLYEKTRAAGFGTEVKRRILSGTYLLTKEHQPLFQRAQRIRTLIRRDFEEAFAKVDVIVSPVAPTAARRLGEAFESPVESYLADTLTLLCNLAGIPGMSVPCGFTSRGLPVGMQVLGRWKDEASILRLGAVYQRETDWHLQAPPEVA